MSQMRFLPVLASLLAAGCPSDPDGNAPVLYLAPDGSEIRVKLVDEEPIPF
jgi:hypothetical protein